MRERKLRFALFLAINLCAVLLDQWTKALAVRHLKGAEALSLWEGVFSLSYVENRGAAFGMMQGKQWLFFVIAAVVLAGVLYVLYRMPDGKRYLPLTLSLSFICSGAVGNMIDRIRQGYVVDFFYFSLIDFPVFNVADIYVTVATVTLMLLLLFYYKEDEFAFLH